MPKVKHDGQTWALCALCCLRNSYMAGVSPSWPKERCSVTKPFFFFTSFVGKRGLRIPWRRVPANVLFPGVVCRGGLFQCGGVVSVCVRVSCIRKWHDGEVLCGECPGDKLSTYFCRKSGPFFLVPRPPDLFRGPRVAARRAVCVTEKCRCGFQCNVVRRYHSPENRLRIG